ncbi:hypothetical protein BD310DRAFT_149771 [Dichomitus squalens]|uniref:Uncharacterized protein n=1 Tax=Dichomitus squalens TaxID=114155 RepID=A0A4Q9Q4N5_9APHY|nr:hypothetical protein BD310DRAFT_149771 [Dichomitus squalens]
MTKNLCSVFWTTCYVGLSCRSSCTWTYHQHPSSCIIVPSSMTTYSPPFHYRMHIARHVRISTSISPHLPSSAVFSISVASVRFPRLDLR